MKMGKWIRTMLAVVAMGLATAGAARAGSLNPTTAPAPTMHTLEEVYQTVQHLGPAQALSATTTVMDAGYYSGGRLDVIDPDLVASNIRAGVLIFGIKGTYVGGCVNPPDGMVMIPAGVNTGSNPSTLESYSLTNETAFYMDKYEVTKEQWDAVGTWGLTHGYTDLSPGAGKGANHPVQTVNWYDCVKWCNARSEKEGREAAYYKDAGYLVVYKAGTVSGVSAPYVKASAKGYSLPTAVQWEYAARGGAVSRRFSWNDSDEIQHARANYYSDGSLYAYDTSPTRGYHPSYTNAPEPYTSPVGSFAPNGYGLFDVTGNVWEWCYDWYPGYVGSARSLRGGGWESPPNYCQVARPLVSAPANVFNSTGFRAVLPPDQ